MPWYTEGSKTNPAADDVLADTNEVAESEYPVTIVISSSVDTNVTIELRNANNDANVISHTVVVRAQTTIPLPRLSIFVGVGQRIRLVMAQSLVGSIQGSIFMS